MKHLLVQLIASAFIANSLQLARCFAQQTQGADPYLKTPSSGAAPAVHLPDRGANTVSFTFETFSMSRNTAIALLAEPVDDERKYQAVLDLVKSGKATEDTVAVTRVKSGDMMTVLGVDEYVFGTSFAPLTASSSIETSSQGPESQHPHSLDAPYATSFNTRNIGETIELQPAVQEDGVTIELTLDYKSVRLIRGEGAKQPLFQTRSAPTSITARSGSRLLFGTRSAPFQSGVSKADPERAVSVDFIMPCVIDPRGKPVSPETPRGL